GGRVDDRQSLGGPFGDAFRTEDRLLDLWRAGHAEKDDIHVARQFSVTAGLLRTFPDEVVTRRSVAMRADRQRETLGTKVFGDAMAHQADADEADPLICRGHVDPPFRKIEQ